jgi:stage II sporulation protein E
MVVMVSECRCAYTLDGGYATAKGTRAEISGDTAALFETEGKNAYALISDGMGSGEEAKRTSEFVSSFLRASLETGASVSSLIGAVNATARARGEECGASIDLFSLDLVTGEAFFVKSGAAPSFIKRGTSLFRIRSKTLPVGVMSEVDAERIGTSVEDGDIIIMMSDGVSADAEAPWLIELLHRPNSRSLKDYASYILTEAERINGEDDDRTVLVLRIGKK